MVFEDQSKIILFIRIFNGMSLFFYELINCVDAFTFIFRLYKYYNNKQLLNGNQPQPNQTIST